MRERAPKPMPTNSARRIAEVLKYAAPESTLSRWLGPHFSNRDKYIKYESSDGPVSLAADYGARDLLGVLDIETAKWGLKIRGEREVYNKPIDIDSFLAQFGQEDSGGETEAQKTEALLLHRIIMHGETNRKLPRWNAGQLEKTITNVYLNNVHTVAKGENDNNGRVYFSYVPNYPESRDAKMIRVITDTPIEEFDGSGRDTAVNRARLLVTIPQVAEALNKLSYHAVTLEPGSDAEGEYINIRTPKFLQRIDLAPAEEVQIENTGDQGDIAGFDEKISAAYERSRHGIDGILMDPDIASVLATHAPNATVIDVGTGAGPVAIAAVEAGAQKVFGIDNSSDMLDKATTAVRTAEERNNNPIPKDSIQLDHGSAENLPYSDNSADLVLSINVGCAVPSEGIFGAHFSEMFRVVRPDRKIFVTAPTTFGEVFTAGKEPKDKILEKIGQTLTEINADTLGRDEATKIRTLREKMGQLAQVNRATFVLQEIDGEKQFVLVYDGRVPTVLKELTIPESALQRGEPIERKLAGAVDSPGLVVPNFYHPQEEYLEAIQAAGLIIDGNRPTHHVMSQRTLAEYNATLPPERQLGREYLDNSPFDIYHLSKV